MSYKILETNSICGYNSYDVVVKILRASLNIGTQCETLGTNLSWATLTTVTLVVKKILFDYLDHLSK